MEKGEMKVQQKEEKTHLVSQLLNTVVLTAAAEMVLTHGVYNH